MKKAYLRDLGCLALCLGMLACGDNGTIRVPDAAPDAIPDAAPDAGAKSTAFVLGTDYTSPGVASVIDIASLRVTPNAVAGVVGTDPALRYQDGRLYIINRFGNDNITIVDAESLALVDQISTGAGTNPQDVAVVGSTLFVAALNAPGILVIDQDEPDTVETIDLSSLDPDRIPDCNSIYAVGSILVATCGVLDETFQPRGPGQVAFINAETRELIDTTTLATPNPLGFLHRTPEDSAWGGDLLIGTTRIGEFTTGCLERISADPDDLVARGCAVENSELGGFASGYAYGPNDILYIAVTQGYDEGGQVASLFAYDVAKGELGDEPLTDPAERVFYIGLCPTGEWVLADAAGGIRIYDESGEERTEDLLDIGLPPVAFGLACY